MNTKTARIVALLNRTRQAAGAAALHELAATIAGATVQEVAFATAAYCRDLLITAQQVAELQRDTLVAQIEQQSNDGQVH